MTTVSVEYEDLETLVWATSVLKNIESLLVQRKSDPFIKPHLDFTEAHNRCASVMRNSQRSSKDTVVPWDGELDDKEDKFLVWLYREGGRADLTADYRERFPEAERLMCKGMIDIGQRVRGVKWPGEPQVEFSLNPTGLAVRITYRGLEKLGVK
jgi:hypothetical protein